MANTKSYFVGPQDGWTQIVPTAGAFTVLRVSAVPHTHPFYIFGDPEAAPADLTGGVFSCHHPFKITAPGVSGAGDDNGFWVRVQNPVPNSKNADGRLRIDVYSDASGGLA